MRKFLALLDARNKEFVRDRSALGWNLLFPVLVVFGFSFAFSNGSQDVFKAAIVPSPQALQGEFTRTRHVTFLGAPELEAALDKLRRQQLDMVIDASGGDNSQGAGGGESKDANAGPRYWINSSSPKGYLLEKVLHGQSCPEGAAPLRKQTVSGRETRYVDWLISGLLAMNMMFSALFGVGYTIVRYRKERVLRRFKAAPVHALEFLSAQVVSRLILIVVTSVAVYVGCNALLRFQMLGSYWDLFWVLCLGAMCLIALGLLIASRTSSEELAGGLLNIISWPMMFLSGVWFSLEGANPWVQRLALAFPLTHVTEAARAIMTEGASLGAVSGHLGVLAAMTMGFLLIGAAAFKWE